MATDYPARQTSRKFKRRPPSAAEQARRVAWGKKHGRLVSEATKQWKGRLD